MEKKEKKNKNKKNNSSDAQVQPVDPTKGLYSVTFEESARRSDPDWIIPRPWRECISYLEAHGKSLSIYIPFNLILLTIIKGTDSEGIFRVTIIKNKI